MPKNNIYKSIAAISLLILFFTTIVSRDFYHLLGHKDEATCSEHDNNIPHFHALDKCNICDHNFSAGEAEQNYFNTAKPFVFIINSSSLKSQYSINLFFQNPDSRGSPVSA